MSAAATQIPFQQQSAEQNRRICGAACLSMVYSSLGKEVSQDEIWPRISRQNRLGSLASSTHLMALDALQRGFGCVAVQARHPLQALRSCRDRGVRVILNHRLRRGSSAGHYSVLTDIDANSVVIHDPLTGPSQRYSHREMLELWMPPIVQSEISGYLLIAIEKRETIPACCQFCNTALPQDVACPACRKMVGLQPQPALGCVKSDCFARLWNTVCCPACDHLWDFTQSSTKSKAAGLDLEKVFSVLDQFTSLVNKYPTAAGHTDVMNQMNLIASNRETLKEACAQEEVRRMLVLGQLADLERTAEQKRQQQRKVMEEIKMEKPLDPLDGNALGTALLQSLGLSR